MSEPERRKAEHNAGAFLISGPFGLVPVGPMRTLGDDYHDEPAEPEDSDRVPEPEPLSRLRRLIRRIRHDTPPLSEGRRRPLRPPPGSAHIEDAVDGVADDLGQPDRQG